MIDLVFVVDDLASWHEENIRLNPSHYSILKYLGPKFISKFQERMTSGIYYNPYVTIDNSMIKYGVMSKISLEDDLQNWSHLYIAGRLHKPVVEIKSPINSNMVKLLKRNREAAMRVALLQLGRTFPKYLLYHTIAEISYLGDFRMQVGENPNKVRNIVIPLVNEFDKIYGSHFNEFSAIVNVTKKDDMIIQSVDPQVRFNHLMSLPSNLQKALAKRLKRDPRLFDIEDSMSELSYLPYIQPTIRKAISDIVRTSSVLQTIQGVVSAGIIKSFRYGLEKVKKKWQS